MLSLSSAVGLTRMSFFRSAVMMRMTVQGPVANDNGKFMAPHPFTDAGVKSPFKKQDGDGIRGDGFCNSADGSVFRIRFMPAKPGDHAYRVTYLRKSLEGPFRTVDGRRRSILRVDPTHPSGNDLAGLIMNA